LCSSVVGAHGLAQPAHQLLIQRLPHNKTALVDGCLPAEQALSLKAVLIEVTFHTKPSTSIN
jgi:hypothetical protein